MAAGLMGLVCFVGSYLKVFLMGPFPALWNWSSSSLRLSSSSRVIFMLVHAEISFCKARVQNTPKYVAYFL